MKKLLLVFVIGIGLVACSDNTQTGTGGSIDSNVTAPPVDNPTDNTNVQPDTTLTDSNQTIDLNNRKDNRDGTSSGESGSSTNSENSGSAKDDNKGSK
jgi:hypothetical protein